MKHKIISLLAVMMALSLGVAACTEVDGQTPAAKEYTANLIGSSEVPAVNTVANGQAVFKLSADGNSMTFTLTVSNIENVTQAHIHFAPAGVAGPVVVPLFGQPKTGVFTGILAEGLITSSVFGGQLLGKTMNDLVTNIEAGNAYVNVHTAQNSPGEIRGQLQLKTAP